jgi:putative transposase
VGAAKEGLLALSLGVGLAVVQELFEAEVTRLAGPKGKHDPQRRAYRHGQEARQVTLGGRRVQVDKPRVRGIDDREIELRTFCTFAKRDLLHEAALGRMLAGLSTRQYPVGLEPIGQVEPLATSKSAISRRFIQAGGLVSGMPAAASAGIDDPATIIVAIAAEIGRGATRARTHRADPTRSAHPRPMSQNPLNT